MNEQLHAAAAPGTLGRYHLSEPLGAGPTGEVFRAKVYGVAGFERQFAVKRFYTVLTEDPQIAQRLVQAARAYQTIEHPRIARLHEYGQVDGQAFAAVELVRGLDLSRLVELTHRVGDKFSPGAALTVVVQIARAVGYAHGRGVLHGGICPSNVLASPDGDVKITDFGFLAARLAGMRVDDPSLALRLSYLAPEQLSGQPATPATDVFQLATLAYELFTGERAFTGQSPEETAAAVRAGNPPTLPLPLPLLQVFKRAFQRVPEDRYLDAGALADALDAANRMAPLAGGRSDVGASVRRAQARREEMAAGQMSGALTLPMLSRQPVHEIGVAPRVPGDDDVTNVAPVPLPPRDDRARRTSGGWDEAPIDQAAALSGGRAASGSPPPPPTDAELARLDESTDIAAPPPSGGYYASPPSSPAPAGSMTLEVPEVTDGGPAHDDAVTGVHVVSARESEPGTETPPPEGASWGETTTGAQDEPTVSRGGDEDGYFEVTMKGASQLDIEAPSDAGTSPGSSTGLTPTPPPSMAEEEEVSRVETLVRGHLPGVTPRQPAGVVEEPSVVTSLPTSALEEDETTTVHGAGAPPFPPALPRKPAPSEDIEIPSLATVRPASPPARSSGGGRAWVKWVAGLAVLLVVAGGVALALRGGGGRDGDGRGLREGVSDEPAVARTPEVEEEFEPEEREPAPDAAPIPVVKVPPAPAGKLVITSNPPGAIVYLDGAKKGRTPVELPATGDRHQLALLKEGHALVRQEINGSAPVSVTLKKVKAKGSGTGGIKVECDTPERFYVIVDGEDTGEICPTERIHRAKGNHTVEVYDPVTQSVTQHPVNIKQTRFSTRVWLKE